MKEGARKEKKGLDFFLNLVDLLKSLVATAYVDCTAYAPCKQLCVEYTTFARIATYCVRIVKLVRVSDLLRTYMACALEATLCVRCTSCVRERLILYVSTTFARKRLMRLKRLVRTMYDLCVRCTTCARIEPF